MLTIHQGFFDENVSNAEPPLNFNKLRTITWYWQERFSGILKTYTKSQMPEILTIKFCNIKTDDFDGLVKFIRSKNTLKSIDLVFENGTGPLSFWRQIVAILNEPSTPRLPFLSFAIYSFFSKWGGLT